MKNQSSHEHRTSIGLRFGVVLVLLAAVTVAIAWAAYDDPPWEPSDPNEGTWVETAYAEGAASTCDAAAGEICKEWCVNSPHGTYDIATGELCCVVGQECRSPR